jgi:hypothetical protein
MIAKPRGPGHSMLLKYGNRDVSMAASSSSPDEVSGSEERVEGSAAENTTNVCKTCGVPKDKMAFGCDGTGRIMGGIGAVPGFGWWPIKAYRPCGKAVEAGIQYRRTGQNVDEILFSKKDP